MASEYLKYLKYLPKGQGSGNDVKRNPVSVWVCQVRRLAYQGRSGFGAGVLVCKTIYGYQLAAMSPPSDELEMNMLLAGGGRLDGLL